GATARVRPGSSWNHGPHRRHDWIWHSWWSPFHWHHHHHDHHHHSWWWTSPFWWTPVHYYRSSWWNDCYSVSWYHRWSHPYHVSASYWWYPSTTYCPVYLQVPSTVVIVD